MNETDVAIFISQKLSIYNTEGKKMYDAIIECMKDELKRGGKVKFVDFGTFEVVNRAPRKGFQPYHRREIDIPACKEPVFTPGKALKEMIKKEL